MRDYVNEHLARHKAAGGSSTKPVVPVIRCRNGTSLSVQASARHYCSPRRDTGPWYTVEVWNIADWTGREIKPRSFSPHTEDPYGYVPVDVVNRFIRRHGGVED